jgi:hypothetical protein
MWLGRAYVGLWLSNAITSLVRNAGQTVPLHPQHDEAREISRMP